jgi:hypothetical protein
MAPPTAIDVEAVTDTEAFVIPDPLTVNGVSARRAKAGKLIAGVAAATSSDQFKTPVSIPLPNQVLGLAQQVTDESQATWKPKAKRWDRTLA